MQLKFYKKGQGYYTRLGTALAGALMSALGCYALFQKLGGISSEGRISTTTKAWIQAGIPTVLFGVLCWGIFKLVNHIRFADFLIATEGEMKKVSWSTRKEIITSTKVVVITVIIMSCILAIVDYFFAFLFKQIGILKVV